VVGSDSRHCAVVIAIAALLALLQPLVKIKEPALVAAAAAALGLLLL